VLDALLSVFPNVVCVDDGSSDDTAQRAEDTKAFVVRHPFNLGAGAATQTGFEFALRDPRAKYFVTFDADGQHRVDDADRMVAELRKGDVDIVLGSRFLDQTTKIPGLKRVVLRMATRFENWTTGTKLTDAHIGLRAFSRRFVEEIEITMPDFAHGSELAILIGRSQMPYMELPVTVEYTEYSRAKGQSLWNSINILFDVFFDYIAGSRRKRKWQSKSS
jgi:glycosyltransferase involved in cell wall biosynthesis